MKQMPPNINYHYPFQATPRMMQWAPYQQVAQQMPNPGTVTEAAPKTGIMGLLKKLNPTSGGLTETLDQIHKLVKMTQSFAPKIQEYGPLIKNLPAMLALMKEFNEADEDEAAQSSDGSEDNLEDDSTDILDKILGLDEDDESLESDEESSEQAIEKVDKKPKVQDNMGDNLFKIETLTDQEVPTYHKPVLYV